MWVKKQQLEPDMEQWTGSKLGKDYIKAVNLFIYLYAGYISWNVRLDKAQAGIKTEERKINNLRHADNTTLMTESEELRSPVMKVKEETEKVGLKLNVQKN